MNSYLLDTHTLLWYSSNDDNLSDKVAEIIKNPDNEIFVSLVSFWEIGIKISIGKLESKIKIEQLEKYLKDNNIKIISIQMENIYFIKDLPLLHKDPFDRLIIAQAYSKKLIILSKDSNFKFYKEVEVVW